ncbi:MAG: ATP-binding protein [Myxococcota bacterium]
MAIAWTADDRMSYPGYAETFLRYRISCSVAAAIAAWLAVASTRTGAKYFWILCWFASWGALSALMIPGTPEQVLSQVFIVLIALLLSPGFIVWPWQMGVIKSLTLVAIAEIGIFFAELDPIAESNSHAYLMTGVVLNAVTGRVRYRLALEQYRTRLELKRKNELNEHLRAEAQTAADRLQSSLEQRTRFFHNVSHELRTPLTLILSPIEQLLAQQSQTTGRSSLKVIRRNAVRLLRMIDDLLDLARLEGGALRLRVSSFDIADLASRVVGNIEPSARAKGVELTFSVTGPQTEVFGDPHRIEIVLTNLVGNALKFTPAGGQIAVDVVYNSAGTSVEVRDTGPGISRKDQALIFERFHQVESSERRRHGGVGIGLSLARELAELHGGSLTVESRVGEGSIFSLFLKAGREHFLEEIIERRNADTDLHPGRRFEDRVTDAHMSIPKAVAELRQSDAPPARVLLDRGRVPRVLVAEDEDDLREFVVGVLSESYHVDAAKNGSEALEIIAKRRPDLVLTDIMMPDTSGLDLCRAIKGELSLQHIPVILLTARGESEAALEGYEAGADDFVSKPFHTKVLLARIRAHLKMRGLSLQLADQARLASAGTLAAGLAHEVKNPLNAVVNAARVLQKGGSGRVSSEKLMGVIVDGIKRIDGIISTLNAHARPADGADLVPCNVRVAVESTLNLLAHKMQRVKVHEDYEVTGDVFVPARAFNQVLLNLVDNAIQSNAGNIWIELKQRDNVISVTVADDGPGVPADMVHRIFDPFFTTRAEGEGTGLGLHLSRRIAQERGGELRYEPRPGGGARFVMELPAMEQAA